MFLYSLSLKSYALLLFHSIHHVRYASSQKFTPLNNNNIINSTEILFRWHIMKRSNQDKIVAQIYLRDWSMKAEILRKAQMYEDTIMHGENKNDCTSNNIHNGADMMNSNSLDNGSNDNIKLYAHTLHCNRSGIYLEKSSSSRSTAVNDNKYCDTNNSASDDSNVSLKLKSNKNRRNKKENVLRMRKYKDIFNMIKPMIAIDKL